MREHELRSLVEAVRSGGISRRTFVERMFALGLTAPLAIEQLAMEVLGGGTLPAGRPAAVFAGGRTHVFAIGAGGVMNH
jgi:peptide/nickel transport system substrate-binding protein